MLSFEAYHNHQYSQPQTIYQFPVPLYLTMASDASIAVLKRKDADIVEVLAHSSHVCLYRMPMETQQWVKRDIEGPIFLVKRNTHPRFQLVVLNKTQTGIFTEDVHGGLDFEVNPPYLMYTHGELEITGMWFYSIADLSTMSAMLQRIQASLPRPEEPEPQALPHTLAAAIDSSASESNNDNDFWDRVKPAAVNKPTVQEHVQHAQHQPQQQQQHARQQQGQNHRSDAPRQESAVNSNFADLLKHAQAKQQLQQQEANGLSSHFATAVAITASPPAAAQHNQPTLLPPRFFETSAAPPHIQPPTSHLEHNAQEQMVIPVRHHTNNNSRVAPALPVTPTAATTTQDTATTSAAPVNSLTRLFGKNAVTTTLQTPPTASAATPTSNRPAHNNAAAAPERPVPSQSSSSNNNHVASQGASTTVPSKQQNHMSNITSTEGLVMRAQIRQAVAQLLTNDVFVDMIGEALQGVGLLQRK